VGSNMSITVETISECKEICRKIINLDSNIKFFGIINECERFIVGQSRQDVKFLVDKKDREMLFMEAILRMRMRQDFNQSLGQVDFTITHRRNVIIIKFQLEKIFFIYLQIRNLIFVKLLFKY